MKINEDLINKALEMAISQKEFYRILGYKNGNVGSNTDKRYKKFLLDTKNINMIEYFLEKQKLLNKSINQEEKICKNCGKVFVGKYSKNCSGEFCCLKCSRTYVANLDKTEKREKIRLGLKKYYDKLIDFIPKCQSKFKPICKKCIICGKEFKTIKAKTKTCSHSCASKLAYKVSKEKHKNWKFIRGGFREKSSRGKQGWYKNIFCNSQWELAFVIYCLDHDIKIERNKENFIYFYKNEQHLFYPDFIVNGKLVEIKNYWREINDIKINAVKQIKDIDILYTKDLEYVFDYILNKYGKDKRHIYELYEKAL